MATIQPKQYTGRRDFNTVLLAMIGAGALAAGVLSLQSTSEQGSSFLLGYSLPRLAVLAGSLLAGGLFLTAAIAEHRPAAWWQRLTGKAAAVVSSEPLLFALICLLFLGVLSMAALLILAVSPAALEFTLLKTLLSRLGSLMIWALLALIMLGVIISLNARSATEWRNFFTMLRLAALLLIALVVYLLALKFYMIYTWDIRMRRMEEYIFLPALVFLGWGALERFFAGRAWYSTAARWMQLLALAGVTYAVYRHTAQWMEWQSTPSKAYWPELANAFLHGRLYLANPGSTHDLTYYQGNWYVPNPPLPALVLMPVMALLGGDINMVVFSILAGVVNVMLVFVMLERAAWLKLTPTNRAANLLITAVFALGTTHWWLSIMGRVWFLSQVLALTCSLAAALLVLRRASPWAVGAFLGLALLARPNMFTLWPFLVGLAFYLMQQTDSRLDWKRAAAWAAQSAVPVVLGAAALLLYNYLRFDDFLDFGYVTITSAEWLMQAVQTYGIFNIYFVPFNFHMMFLKMPLVEMRGSCFYFSPTREGFSMLAMTPALVYTIRRFRWNWWTAGAWVSVILSLALLMLYHNNGAWQLGYRYLMDFIVPVLLLLAVSVGPRPSWVFKSLALLGLLVNAASIIWWFEKWPC